uniref:Uncharacterized protein n=1 Tax=Spongospora subterranea TaxID=70186 RepID=A0A0H5QQM9_9EUKA|eukprot:CRZ04385.1 hypothetical protein [Spongospora subterranea]
MRALPLMEQAFYRFLGSKPETTRKCDQFFIRAAKTYELPDPLALPPLLITKLSNTFKDALVKLASSFMVPIQSAPSPLKMQGVSSIIFIASLFLVVDIVVHPRRNEGPSPKPF